MKLIVGLGNPGSDYEGTRHNIGFAVVDRLATDLDSSMEKEKFSAHYATAHMNGEKVILVKPNTFMNLSGSAVRQFLDYWKVSGEDLLVVHDDIDFPLGEIKLVFGAGPAGHNGVTSIISEVSSKNFYRLRIGIGRPLKGDVVQFVLSRFEADQDKTVEQITRLAAEASSAWVLEGPEAALRRLQ